MTWLMTSQGHMEEWRSAYSAPSPPGQNTLWPSRELGAQTMTTHERG